MDVTLKFKTPFTAVLAAPSCSGKTSWLLKFLSHLSEVVDGRVEHLVWCYGEEGAIPEAIANNSQIRKYRGVPTAESGVLIPHSLLILDDLMNDAYNQTVSDVYTKLSHHRQVSIILVTQNLFFQSRHSRNISLSTKYFILLRNCRERSQFSHLARQVYPENPKSLCEALCEAWSEAYGYLVIDVSPQQTVDAVRFRRNIWPTDPYTIVYSTQQKIQQLQDCGCSSLTIKDLS
jgi:hypothetical protein